MKRKGANMAAYQYTNSKGTNYYLHRKEITLRGSGVAQVIYYFAKEAGPDSIENIPQGYMVVENPRTGLPILKRETK